MAKRNCCIFILNVILLQTLLVSWRISVKEYLGDSVYAEYDGYGIFFTTENGLPDDPSNTIYVDPDVFKNLCDFHKKFFGGIK